MSRQRKVPIVQDVTVQLFAEKLREVRNSLGMTQLELSRKANVTPSYIWRLESGGAAPGIDLVARLANALGATSHELLPITTTPDSLAVLRGQARKLFESLLSHADRETLLMLNPLLARLQESAGRRR